MMNRPAAAARGPSGPSPVTLVADPLLLGGLRELATHQLGLLTVQQVRAHHITASAVRHRLTHHRWRQPTRGVLDVGALVPTALPPARRSERTAILGILTFGPESVAVGLSALALRGVWGVPPSAPPQIALPGASDRLDRDGIRCRRFRPRDEPTLVGGYRAVSAVDALAQSLPEVDTRTALGLLDSALHRGVLEPEQLAALRSRLRGRRGCRGLSDVWLLVDSRRESPIESWACFDLHAAGLPPSDLQVTFTDGMGRVLARSDIGFELDDNSWHLVELDGRAYHLDGAADELRDNALALAAARSGRRATVVRYRSEHLGPRGRLVREVGQALRGRTWSRAPSAGLSSREMPAHDNRPALGVQPQA